MTRNSPLSDRHSAAEAPVSGPTQRRVRRTRAEPKLYISHLPEGKGGPRTDKGSVPLEVDVEDHIEERSDCEPGLYRIEKKRSGEFSGEVLFYEKEQAPEPGELADDVFDSGSIGAGVTATSPAEIAQVVSTVLDARERRQRSVGQADPMDQFRQMREMLKEEREEMQLQLRESESSRPRDTLADFERFIELQKKLQPEPRSDELSATDRAQLILVKESGLISEFMRNMRDMLRAPEAATAEAGLVDKALALFQSALPYVGPVAGPALGQKLAALVERIDVGALAQKVNNNVQAQTAPSVGEVNVGPDPRASAFARVMRRIAVDLVDNAPPDAAVAATLQLVTAYPALTPQFQQILGAAPGDVATFLSTQLDDDVRVLSHCNDWVTSYQSKLRDAATAPTTSMESGDGNDEDDPLTFDDVLHFIKAEIIANNDPAEAASSVIQLLAEQPELAPTIRQLLATPSAELVTVLSQATQADLTIVANAESFVEKLKAAVNKRVRMPVVASENGHKGDVPVTAEAKVESGKESPEMRRRPRA